MQLGVDFLEERGKAVLGLRGTRAHRHKIVKDKVIICIILFVYIQLLLYLTNKIKGGNNNYCNITIINK